MKSRSILFVALLISGPTFAATPRLLSLSGSAHSETAFINRAGLSYLLPANEISGISDNLKKTLATVRSSSLKSSFSALQDGVSAISATKYLNGLGKLSKLKIVKSGDNSVVSFSRTKLIQN